MNKQPKILVVDDDQDILDGIQNLLKREYNITLASNGKTALEILKKESFNLILLDIMMPHMDGFQLAENIIKENIQTPFMFLSAKSHIESKVQGLKIGAEDYITKPFSKDELRLRIQKKLDLYDKLDLRNKRLALIHHNVLTPISVIHGNYELIIQTINKIEKNLTSNIISNNAYMFAKKDWEKLKKELDGILENLNEGVNLIIKQSKKFVESRVLSNSEIPILKRIIPINELIYQCVAISKPKKLLVKISDLPEENVYTDFEKINQVFLEILENSLIHNHQKEPEIQINAEIKNDHVYFTFTDNGPGIASEDIKHIFTEFWSGYDVSHHKQGEGIGLWICKRYLSLLNGEINVKENTPNAGTTIEVSLPLHHP